MGMEVFNKRFLPLRHKLFRFALRIMGNKADAEDVVQEVFIRIWKKQDEWPEWNNPEAMCMTITRNLCMDKKRSKHYKTQELPEHYDQVDTAPNPEQETVVKNSFARIQNMMKELSDTQKSVMQLRDIEGYSYKEIAETLGLSLNQVKISLHRARLHMRHLLLKTRKHGTI